MEGRTRRLRRCAEGIGEAVALAWMGHADPYGMEKRKETVRDSEKVRQ